MNKREIKFRAWSNDQMYTQPSDTLYSLERFLGFITNDSILMQFTGLKDRNGKEIYEGDIVRAEGQRERYIQVIEFHNTPETCGRGWIGRNIIQEENIVFKTPEKRIDDRLSYFCWPASWEVIGNIYETPELIALKRAAGAF